MNLAVRKFFPESGESYWKAVLVDGTLRQQLHDMNDADLLKQLNDAKDELESLRNREPEYNESARRRVSALRVWGGMYRSEIVTLL